MAIWYTVAHGDTVGMITIDGNMTAWCSIWGNWHKANGDSAYYGQGGGGAAWGEITGTLSNQSDLNTALLGKENLSAKGAANGYPSLDANSKVPTLYLGGSGADNMKYLRGDQTWATPAGGGAGGDSVNAFQNEWYIQKNSGLTTWANVGFATAPTSRGTVTNLKDSTGQWANFATAAVVDSQGGLRSNVWTETSAQEKPFFKAYVRTGSTAADTQGKIWVGLTSGSLKAATDTALHVAAFRFVPGTAGGWSLYTNDGSGTGTATASGVTISLTKRYRFGVRVYSSHTATDSVVFYIDGARVGKNTTDLPAFATNLGYHVCVSTKATTARNFRIGKIYLLTGAGK